MFIGELFGIFGDIMANTANENGAMPPDYFQNPLALKPSFPVSIP
jgi:hypothetical protein